MANENGTPTIPATPENLSALGKGMLAESEQQAIIIVRKGEHFEVQPENIDKFAVPSILRMIAAKYERSLVGD